MKKSEYFQYHQECTAKMTAITKAKNADYTGEGDDPFSNFTRVEALGICSTEQGFLTRMTDKLSRLTSFSQKGIFQVKDESVEDTLLDLANYCILMAGYIRSKKNSLLTTEDDVTYIVDDVPVSKEYYEKLLQPSVHVVGPNSAQFEGMELRRNDWIAP